MLVTAGRLPSMLMDRALLVIVSISLFGSTGVGAAPAGQVPPQVTPRPIVRPILLTDAVPDPEQAGVQWFVPTGHTLRGIFLDYWNKYGGLYQFGYPLTEEFFEPVGTDNRLLRVQYFERNRFEFHPEFANTQYEVLLGSLGRDFRTQDPPTRDRNVADNAFFGETGHNLYGPFRSYWEKHGGAFVHGFPMTEAYMEKNAIDGKMYLVQYFERSRFELHPEYKGTRYEILLGLLGRQLSEKKGLPHGWYPLYGHAPDYSWFAGYYKADPRKCAQCGCSTVRYVHPSDTTYTGAGEVLPYFQEQPLSRQLNVNGLEATLDPRIFIVVFGQLDDPNSIATSKPTVSCLSPRFKVTDFQLNPTP